MLPDGYSIRPLSLDHAPALAAAYDRNLEHLGRWDPARPPTFFTAEGQLRDVERQLEQREGGLVAPYVVVAPDGDLAGTLSIQHIVRGHLQGGTVGYWVDRRHLRRGLATAAVEHLEGEGLTLGLHRLEAGTMVDNAASQRVLEARGFERIGLARQLLFLNGAWRDHVLFQKLLHDRPLT